MMRALRPFRRLTRSDPRLIGFSDVVRRHRRSAAIGAILCAIAAAATLALQPTQYRTEAVLTVSPPPAEGASLPSVAETALTVLGGSRVAALATDDLDGEVSAHEARDRTRVIAGEQSSVLRMLFEGTSADATLRLAEASLEAGLPEARAALPDGARLEIVARPSRPEAVPRRFMVVVGTVIGLMLVAGGLAAIAAEARPFRARR